LSVLQQTSNNSEKQQMDDDMDRKPWFAMRRFSTRGRCRISC